MQFRFYESIVLANENQFMCCVDRWMDATLSCWRFHLIYNSATCLSEFFLMYLAATKFHVCLMSILLAVVETGVYAIVSNMCSKIS